jgi:hypothetical protein
MQYDLEAGAVRCATLLDQAHPGWAEKTNLEKLDMASPETEVLSQIFGRFKDGFYELHLLDSDKDSIELGYYYGIFVPLEVPREDRPALYAKLTKKWKELIIERRTS